MPDDLGTVGKCIHYDIERRRRDAGSKSLSLMPRSRNEKLSASTRTPAPASLVRSSERAPARAGSTPFWTRNRVTSFFAATSCCARSQQKRTSLESNGSRDSINRYLVIGISLWADSLPLRLDARPNRAAAQTAGKCHDDPL